MTIIYLYYFLSISIYTHDYKLINKNYFFFRVFFLNYTKIYVRWFDLSVTQIF